MEEDAQRDCGVSSCGGIQNLIGHGHGQSALTQLAISRVVGLSNLQRSLPTSIILWLSLCLFSCLTTLNAENIS